MAKVADTRNQRGGDFDALPKTEVKVGDWICFKSDFEQSGQITKIVGDRLYLENKDGFGGDYLRYATTTVEYADDCWI